MNWEKLLNNGRLRGSVRGADSRNDFESDFGRIIFSPALRRMHDKTQVFPLTADDNIHSRLTHSMEVMAIGHSLGIKICEDDSFVGQLGKSKEEIFREIPVILKNACLIHDIGNPPFGHFGETVFQTYFKKYFADNTNLKLSKEEKEDFTFFDGNAQGFRVVTKLQILNDEYGLNLTYATLASYAKYPNYGIKDKAFIHKKKRGVFQSEIPYLNKISSECGLEVEGNIIRHPLCFLMEAADSICYSVMDIEDGFSKGWYSFDSIVEKLSSIQPVLEKAEEIKKNNNGIGEDITRMVKFRIYLIQYLVNLASDNFLKNLDLIKKGEYNKELILDDPNELAQKLQSFCYDKIFPSRDITSLELIGHSVISGLLNIYIGFVFHSEEGYRNRAQGLISESILRIAFLENGLPQNSKIEDLNDYFKLRIIVDYISGMTDQFALNHYQKLSGQKTV
jgi:dGTPase